MGYETPVTGESLGDEWRGNERVVPADLVDYADCQPLH
ncbi:MAG: hypothetical protein FD167_2253, partial [bacterium]